MADSERKRFSSTGHLIRRAKGLPQVRERRSSRATVSASVRSGGAESFNGRYAA